MLNWSQKTVQEKQQAKEFFVYNFLFRTLNPKHVYLHFEKTKKILSERIFARNHIQCNTSQIYFFSQDVATEAVKKLVGRVLAGKGEVQWSDMEKLKNALVVGEAEVPWFLK